MFQGILNLNESTVVLTLTLNSVGPKAQADTARIHAQNKGEGGGKEQGWFDEIFSTINPI